MLEFLENQIIFPEDILLIQKHLVPVLEYMGHQQMPIIKDMEVILLEVIQVLWDM